jgi:hypothetical protein
MSLLNSFKWFGRMMRDILVYGWVNRSFGMTAILLALIFIGFLIAAAVFSAANIYTLF